MMEIFVRDTNGFQSCDVKDDGVIIDAANSYKKACNDIEGSNPETTYYTCKYCQLLFNHPKRFLIHCKWHQMHTDSLRHQTTLAFKKQKIQKTKKKSESSDNSNSDDKDLDESSSKKFCWKTNKCEFCEIPLKSLSIFKDHYEKVHKVDGLFKCPYCDKKYRHKNGWMRHAYTHKIDQCNVCGKYYASVSVLKKHMKMEPTLECPVCPKKFALKQLLDQHVKNHTEPRKKSHKCSYCGRGFVDVTSLEVHERGHRKEKIDQCNVCGKYYASVSVLKKHMKMVHSKDNAFNCDLDECTRTFATQFLKKIHMQREHSIFDGKKITFPCKVCGLVLITPHDLKKHRKVHRIQENVT